MYTQENIDHAPAESEAPPSRPESPEIVEENNGAFYHRGAKAVSIAKYKYKIRDDSVKPRQFLGTDTEDGIEAILSERQGHSLHEFIDGDDLLRPFIDFDLSREKFDKIKPKLKLTAKEIRDLLYRAFKEVCLEIYPDWNRKTLTIASSSDEKKMSLHISTFGLRLKNIAKVAVFTELVRKKLPIDLQEKDIVDNIANKSSFSLRMLNTPKVIEIKCNESGKKSYKHIRPKRAIFPKDSSVFDFMLRPPNDETPVIDSPILNSLKSDVNNSPISIPGLNINIENSSISVSELIRICNNSIESSETELQLVKELLEHANISGYEVSYPTENYPNTFYLKHITPSNCPLCKREDKEQNDHIHENDNAYVIRNKKSYSFYCYRANDKRDLGTRKPSIKLTINESAKDRENKFSIPPKLEKSRISDLNDNFVWGNLLDMCISEQRYTRKEVYKAIQATVACVQTTSRLWLFKMEDSDNGLYFDIASKLDLANYKISITEHGEN
ncbi:hypothetical protein C2G38_2210559 [Gigaspora rosea]|uniref:Uncharacterized protein n=1 Tax=Gigaspora rosea TaxID=44941 RepID=A0A397UF86_9GLOM|nr:hypothetical protein C2G38_2210559 [Gigaspora rosea]